MLPGGGEVIPRRKLLDQLDVGRQSRPRESSFEKIVAEQRVVRDAVCKRRLEHIDIVDALADVRALIEKVLVNVGNREGVRVDSSGARKHALKNRTVTSGRQCCRDSRLQDS